MVLVVYLELGNFDVGELVFLVWECFGVNFCIFVLMEVLLVFGWVVIDVLCDVFDVEWIGIGGDEVFVIEWE